MIGSTNARATARSSNTRSKSPSRAARGSVLVGCIALQAITGWTLMAYYAPSATTAWASVEHISYGVSGGWLVRGMHHFGAQAMVVV